MMEENPLPVVAPASSGSDSAITSEDSDDGGLAKVRRSHPLKNAAKLPPNDTGVCAAFESAANRAEHEAFLGQCAKLLIEEAVFKSTSREEKLLEWHQPEELLKIFELELREDPSTHERLLQLVRDTIKYSVKTGHPYFVNQLFSAVDPYGLAGQWLTDALNPSVYTYEVAPVFTLMEETVLRQMRTLLGWTDGRGDGIFCPGGSVANGYGISCARHKFFPDIKQTGLCGLPRLVLFTSKHAHYSVQKLASFMGLGTRNVYTVDTDERGRMCMANLRTRLKQARDEGAVPFMVSATAGTTVLGAFDPIDQLADICQAENLWLHVDAAWGGGALMSNALKHLLSGIHKADSVTWNPHKLLTAPQQCSTFLVRHEGLLANAHASHAAYLFQPDKCYDASLYDTGDKHIQCGRRADVLKFWFMWQAKGTAGLRAHVEKLWQLAGQFRNLIRSRPGYELVLEHPECTNICFWYIPPSLRGLARSDEAYRDGLHRVAPKMKSRMMEQGTMMCTYQAQDGLPNFFRIVFQNSSLQYDDMLYFVNEFERLGHDL